jgi:hypothetical protein
MKMREVVALVGLLMFTSACASVDAPSRADISQAKAVRTAENLALPNDLTLGNVEVAFATNALWTTRVSRTDFQSGLLSFIRNEGLMGGSDANPSHRLSVVVQSVGLPYAGYNVTVPMTVRYVITPVDGTSPVFDELISSTGFVKGTAAEYYDDRQKLAIDNAARANFAKMLRRVRGESQ